MIHKSQVGMLVYHPQRPKSALSGYVSRWNYRELLAMYVRSYVGVYTVGTESYVHI